MFPKSYTLNALFKTRDALFQLVTSPEPYWTADFRRELENALAKVRREIENEVSIL